MNDSRYYVPHLEWESIPFPLTITKLASNESFFGFTNDSVLTIERTKDYRLVGILAGIAFEPTMLNEEKYIGKGNIIEGRTLIGEDEKGNIIELANCHIVSYYTNSLNKPANGYFIQGNLIAEKLTITYKGQEELANYKRLDWFICSKPEAHFWGTTIRRSNSKAIKIRKGIDEHTEADEMNPGISWAKDYTKVDLEDFSFIIAKVPEKIFDSIHHGLCLEFRDDDKFIIPDESTINQIKKFISFILGNKLTHIGYSIIKSTELQKAICYSLESDSLRLSAKTPMPPITFNTKYEWGDFSYLVTKLLPEYLTKNNKLKLGDALSRYWISKGLPVGVNLPVLSSAVEIIATEYLKHQKEFNKEIIPDKKYAQLIEAEIEKLQAKLSAYPENEIIINNIKKANKKSINVQMNAFFKLIGINVGKDEKSALHLRNKMVHGSRVYSKDEKVYDDLVLTRIYEVLFNRVFLKLLGYNDYYTDYSLQNSPLKHISKSAGAA
jgi:hypothetical protein